MKILGIAFSYSERENLRELTRRRTLGSLPMAGRYRMIDFLISNFVNDGIYDVAVIARENYHSLMDHLGAGKEWDLIRKRGGLRLLTPYAMAETGRSGLYRGSVEALANNMHSFRRSMADLVIMADTSILSSMDYNALAKYHLDSKADITAVYTRLLNGHPTVPIGVSILHFDENNRLYDLNKNQDDMSSQDVCWSTGAFVIRKSLLDSLIADSMAYGKYCFYLDILKRLASSLVIKGYEYKGHLLEVSSVSGYMKANMNFLDSDFRQKAFMYPIYTKSKDGVPARYFAGCKVGNSIISDGCRIEGTIENSIISRNVTVGKDAVVRNSIIMQNTVIMKGVSLDHVILDKDVIVRENRELSGHITYPVVVEKASII